MRTGPLAPITFKAIRAIDTISKALEEAPRDEWAFILLQAKGKAKKKINS